MAKKKYKITKRHKQKLRQIGLPLSALLLGLLIGILVPKVLSKNNTPGNLVWAADNTVKVPGDLTAFLESQNSCQHYRGSDSPTGIGLWGVYQVSQKKFAKIAYGCSWGLDPYIMAVKQNNSWQLLQPADYFAPFKESPDGRRGALPLCTVVQKYKIPKDIESFCIQVDGSAKSSDL